MVGFFSGGSEGEFALWLRSRFWWLQVASDGSWWLLAASGGFWQAVVFLGFQMHHCILRLPLSACLCVQISSS